MIYQAELGTTNTGKTPEGGVIVPGSDALSMATTIANPITYYGSHSAVINQGGHSGDLYNYYWTSYSRGTDGHTDSYPTNKYNWHNVYLDGYIPLRVKSIYDPCPYLYRIPSNGTYNQFNMQLGWTDWSYLGGGSCNINTGVSYFTGLGMRGYGGASAFVETGRFGNYLSSTTSGQTTGYALQLYAGGGIYPNNYNGYSRSYGLSVRCIDFAALGFLFNCR